MKALYSLVLSVVLLLCLISCKKSDADLLGGAPSKTFYQKCGAASTYNSIGHACSQLTLYPDKKANIFHMGDIVSDGSYTISDKKLKVTLSFMSYEFSILSSSKLKDVQTGSIWESE